ncbi:MAG: DNA-processing protein DprA [Bacteroidales bacterium]|jgi:DNA processing protein|nr:DNA-processing protein DprA [Bacteroidales bacterium]
MENRETEILYTIALTQIPTVGHITAKKLIAVCGNAEVLFKEPAKNLSALGINSNTVQSIVSMKSTALDAAYREMDFIQKNEITVFLSKDKAYPERLTRCPDSPVILYGKGHLDLNPKHSVAVVGTRKFTTYGIQATKKIIEELASYKNIQIISGLAAGIDTVAHQTALQHDLSTVAVLGHGLQTLYPVGNKKLAKAMLAQGGLVTEFTSTVVGEPHNFPRRNRIIAGMSDAVLVAEAYEKGGALITANIAFSYARDVFTLPARIGDKSSEGCNNLIKRNIAALITSGEDIIKMMMWDNKSDKTKPRQTQLMLDMNTDEQLIINTLEEKKQLNIDELMIATGLSTTILNTTLLNMEFRGLISCLPGKRYILTI